MPVVTSLPGVVPPAVSVFSDVVPVVPVVSEVVPLSPSVQRLPVGAAVEWGTIKTTAGRQDSSNVHNNPMTSAGMVINPWPLLRNDASDGGRQGLHLVVHGLSLIHI